MDKIDRIFFHGHFIDVYGTPEEPLFLAVEIAKLIDYSIGHTAHMLETVDDNEKALINVSTRRVSANGAHNVKKWFLTEYGLYEVLMQSRKPIARRFKKVVKNLLRDLRRSKGGKMSALFDYIDMEADFDALNALRDDMNLPSMTWEEYLENREEE